MGILAAFRRPGILLLLPLLLALAARVLVAPGWMIDSAGGTITVRVCSDPANPGGTMTIALEKTGDHKAGEGQQHCPWGALAVAPITPAAPALPAKLASVHPRFRTPHVVTMMTGVAAAIAAAILPVGKLADYSNAGTLFAFFMVAISVMVLRRTDPDRVRPFRTPAVYVVAPLAIIGCVVLYLSLPLTAKLVLPIWGAIGLLIYFGYSRSRSYVGRGIIDTVDDPAMIPETAKPIA